MLLPEDLIDEVNCDSRLKPFLATRVNYDSRLNHFLLLELIISDIKSIQAWFSAIVYYGTVVDIENLTNL